MNNIFGDLGSAVVIILLISIIHGISAISIGISNIKKNWNYYKCKPEIIPFAGIFGHDVGENFTECVQLNQIDFMGGFLEPIYQSLEYFAQNGAMFTNMFEKLKLFSNIQNLQTMDFVEDAKGRLYNMSDGANRIYIGINDTFSKLTSTITVIFYTVQAAIQLGKSSYEELPGTFIKIATMGGA